MNTITMPRTNGQKRPSLSEQIGRLDTILDGLSENLTDAIADGVKAVVGTAVHQAVEAVLKEVLTNPTILAKLQPLPVAPAADPAPAPTQKAITLTRRLSNYWQRVRGYAGGVAESCQKAMQRLRSYADKLWQKAIAPVTALWNYRELLWHFKGQILTAMATGLLMAVLAYFAGPWIPTAISGIGGFMTTLAVQAGLWVRSLRSDGAQEMA